MKEVRIGLLVLLVFSVLLGIVYPLAVTAISQVAFPHRANGSLIGLGDRVVGSELIGQSFSSPGYFHGRPSSSDYDPMNSGGSNLASAGSTLLDEVEKRIASVRSEYGLPREASVPADFVLSSASGLDPEISVASAVLQVERISAARGIGAQTIQDLIQQLSRGPFLGAFGEERVNVLRLNLALDRLAGPRAQSGSGSAASSSGVRGGEP